ncbi:hypothetical protein [Winogradskya humida]|nr:hypothetical protein [Actinoplanes humidus]
MLFGLIGLVSFLPMARGESSWAVAPGAVLLIVGGVYGLFAQLRSGNVNASRRAGFRALLWTAAGLLTFFVAIMLTTD